MLDYTIFWIMGAFIVGILSGYFCGKYEERRNVIEYIREINIADLMDILTNEIELQIDKDGKEENN